ncbi:hypothetical protein EV356DRAFT_510792 [Viridothelium virens]|uniref:Uncharacterized protein n=1 Tax=Viridothelium virens TaxID=1048519 RepID=A0A6A6GUW5_VIRVR|nr:hypothetical protein EV356DRAFT_510792 [Viridothelium virens]
MLASLSLIPTVNSDAVNPLLQPRQGSPTSSIVYWPSYSDVSNPALPVRSTPVGGSTVKLPIGITTVPGTVTAPNRAGQLKAEATSSGQSSVTNTVNSPITAQGSGHSEASSTATPHATTSAAQGLGERDVMMWCLVMGVWVTLFGGMDLYGWLLLPL